jgi:hypothetical protein
MAQHRLLCLIVSLLLCASVAFGQQDTSPCAQTPLASPKQGANMFTPEQEAMLGDFFAEHGASSIRPIEDKNLSAELERIGGKLVKHLPPTNLKFQFFLSDASEANAFSLVGGRVYVTRKLVATVKSEDELAGVMGHELGHIVTHQQAKLYTRVFQEKLGIREVGDRKDLYQKLNRMWDEWNKHGSVSFDPEQDQQEADRIGMEAVVRAGYSPLALAEFWDRFRENKGKTGSWFSELLKTTAPDTKRYREMTKELGSLPATCRDIKPQGNPEDFKKWQSAVATFRGLRTSDELHNVVWEKQLDPPLQDAIHTLKFSPDGKYVLAQDGGNIYVLTRDPFRSLFRINASDAYPAQFTPDSSEIIFYDNSLRVERWNLKNQQQVSVAEVYVAVPCMQTLLSPDGKTLACYRETEELELVDVPSGAQLAQKKNFLEAKADLQSSRLDALRYTYTLKFINMRFSPDGRYFIAGLKNENNFLFDIPGKKELPVSGSLKGFIGTAFGFISPDKIVGYAGDHGEKSAIVEFPSGKVLRPVDLGGARPTPATHGDYILIRPIKDYAVGILDVSTNQIVGANKQAALDVYDKQYVSELKNGHIGLFAGAPNPVAEASLPKGSLGRLRSTALSDDLNWLAVSEKMRGAIWSLPTGSRVLNLREFRGAYISSDGYLFADFPKHDPTPRSIAKIGLQQRQFTEAVKSPDPSWRQEGSFLVDFRPASRPPTAPKADEEEHEAEAAGEGLNIRVELRSTPPEYRQNTVFEVRKVESGELLWSRAFPKETPRYSLNARHKTVIFTWFLGQDAAKNELRAHADWKAKASSAKDGDVLAEVYNLETGALEGGAVINTGEGSFRVRSTSAEGDWLVLQDERDRIILYSLSTGREKAKEAGELMTFSAAAGALCLEKVPGRLEIYSIDSMEKIDEFAFASGVAMARFTADKKLFVLTTDQTAHLLQISTSARAAEVSAK